MSRETIGNHWDPWQPSGTPAAAEAGEGSHAVDSEAGGKLGPASEDEAMGELNMVDEGDEEALLELAKRLKRARRAAPY